MWIRLNSHLILLLLTLNNSVELVVENISSQYVKNQKCEELIGVQVNNKKGKTMSY